MNLDYIERRMAEKGLTRHDLARMLELNASTLWRLLTGKTRPKYIFFAALAQVLECSVAELQTVPQEPHECPRCRFKLSAA